MICLIQGAKINVHSAQHWKSISFFICKTFHYQHITLLYLPQVEKNAAFKINKYIKSTLKTLYERYVDEVLGFNIHWNFMEETGI